MDKDSIFRPREWIILIFLAFTRLLAMYIVPLNDTTEARYSEIARKMLVYNDWIILWHKKGVPFWGKPPLSIWLSAISMKIFGVNAFAARLPDFLLSIILLIFVMYFIKFYRGVLVARISVLVLASTFLLYLIAGTMMMDPLLLFAVFLCEISFFRAIESGHKLSGYLFFLGLAIGLLTKGLLIVIIIGGICLIWVIWQRRWLYLWQRLPLFTGTIGMLILVLPWYILAEYKTPGFLNYFIVGEHFSRFMHTGWQGDKYGFAHAQVFGIIWIYTFVGTLPWSLFLFNRVFTLRYVREFKCSQQKIWMQYWLLCFIWPLIFFTFAHNLIYPYAAPMLPAFAILFAEFWHHYYAKSKLLLPLTSIAAIGCIIIVAIFYFNPAMIARSQNRVVALWQKEPNYTQNPLMYWRNAPEFSAEFYTHGNVDAAVDISDACSKINPLKQVYWVVADDNLYIFKDNFKSNIQIIGKIKVANTFDNLIKIINMPCSHK